MTFRTRLFTCAALPLAVLAGCSTYQNANTCKERMRAEYPDAASAPLALTSSTASYRGARVVVSGEITKPPVAGKKVVEGAAVECTFADGSITGFKWLAPATLAAKPDDAQ